MKKYSWNFNQDDEIWKNDDEDSIEECIAKAKQEILDCNYSEDEIPRLIFIGENIEFVPCVDIDLMLENIEEQANDHCGEVGYEWEAYNHKKFDETEELQDKINKVVHEWMKKYEYYPNFYSIENIKEYWLEDVKC